MPGYLRQPPWWKQAVPVGVVVVSLALVALLFFMIVGGDRTPTSVAQRPTASDVETVEEIAPVEPAAQPAEEPTAADESPSPETAAEPAEPDDADSEPETQSTTPAPPTPTPAVTVPDVAAPVTATVTPSGTVPEPKVEPAPARREVAQFTSTSGLLLNHVAKANEWTRLPSRALIYSGDSILVPPLYRARFSLGTGGELDVAGATSLELLSPPADAGLAFRLHFGRFVLRDLPVGTAVLVKLDEESWEFRVSSGGSVLAFEAVARMPQGFESTLSNPRYDMRLVVPQGQVSWQGGQGTIEQSSVLTLLSSEGELGADPVVAPLGDAPAWIEGEELGILDQNASRRLQDETLVPFDKDVSLPLIEATQDRRQEVRTLATGTLGAMGNYSALFEALTYSDAEVRREAVVWLRRWLARSGEHVAAVRGEIDRFRPGQGGKNLDRLLWGYTDRDLQDGGAEELINSLENDDLPIRELALFNLEEITGRTLNFQPDSPPLQRDRSVRQWRQLLEDGKLLARQRGRI
jgi:hypothetical protein